MSTVVSLIIYTEIILIIGNLAGCYQNRKVKKAIERLHNSRLELDKTLDKVDSKQKTAIKKA